ncbi:hypothetical protein TWF281_010849 [Arthrobotrys megalospora]
MGMTVDDYTIGLICPLSTEKAAALAILDGIHPKLSIPKMDSAVYEFGHIGEHNVVIGCLPRGRYGIASAAALATHMRSSFPALKFGLLVGIGGAAPTPLNDIRLGDVVVSQPGNGSNGVIQHDFGKALEKGRFLRTVSLDGPPSILLSALSHLQAVNPVELGERILAIVQKATQRNHGMYDYPGQEADQLFLGSYSHTTTHASQNGATCAECHPSQQIKRPKREHIYPRIHCGLIASGDQVIKDAVTRNIISAETGCICFEMEAAGVMNHLPCLVIRGICDYCDSHKSKLWQPYAAIVAAAYAKELLKMVPKANGYPEHRFPSYLTGWFPSKYVVILVLLLILSGILSLSQEAATLIHSLEYRNSNSYRAVKDSSPYFIGRKAILNQLAIYFARKRKTKLRRFLLYGLAGSGKTQICLRFAEQFQKIFWVDASNRETLEQSFQDIAHDQAARQDHVGNSRSSVLLWLSQAKFEWLIVLDNADGDPSMISDYIPCGHRGNILITSRNPNMRHLVPPESSFEVGKMTEADSILLLAQIAGISKTELKSRKDELKAIVSELGFLALGIDHAGAAIAAGISSIPDYLQDLRRHPQYLLGHHSLKGASNYNYNFYGALRMSFAAIEKVTNNATGFPQNSEEEIAIQLFNFFSFLHYNDISEEIFRRIAEQRKCKPITEGTKQLLPRDPRSIPCHILQLDENGNWDSHVFRKGIGVLISLSFVKKDTAEGAYSLHPLVHSWARKRLTQSEQYIVYQSTRALLTASISFGRESEDYIYRRSTIPHINSLRAYIAKEETLDAHTTGMYDKYSLVYHENGYYTEAERLGSRAIEAQKSIFGIGNQTTLASMARLGTTYRLMGETKKSGGVLQEVFEIRKANFGEKDPETLDSFVDLAVFYSDEGQYMEAEGVLRDVLRGRKEVLGDDDPKTLETTLSLSIVLHAQHRYIEAESLGVLVVESLKKALKESHPTTVLAMAALAAIYNSSDQLDKAAKLKVRVLELRRASQGPEHPDTLMALSNLAATYCRQRRWGETEKIVIPLIEARTRRLGEKHPETLRSMLTLTNSYIGQGKWAEAEAMCLRVIEGRNEKLREGHPETLWAMHKLAVIYNGQGRLEQAEDLWKEVVKMQIDKFGENINKEKVQVMYDLAWNLKYQGKPKQAITLMRQVVERQSKARRYGDPIATMAAKALEEWHSELGPTNLMEVSHDLENSSLPTLYDRLKV